MHGDSSGFCFLTWPRRRTPQSTFRKLLKLLKLLMLQNSTPFAPIQLLHLVPHPQNFSCHFMHAREFKSQKPETSQFLITYVPHTNRTINNKLYQLRPKVHNVIQTIIAIMA